MRPLSWPAESTTTRSPSPLPDHVPNTAEASFGAQPYRRSASLSEAVTDGVAVALPGAGECTVRVATDSSPEVSLQPTTASRAIMGPTTRNACMFLRRSPRPRRSQRPLTAAWNWCSTLGKGHLPGGFCPACSALFYDLAVCPQSTKDNPSIQVQRCQEEPRVIEGCTPVVEWNLPRLAVRRRHLQAFRARRHEPPCQRDAGRCRQALHVDARRARLQRGGTGSTSGVGAEQPKAQRVRARTVGDEFEASPRCSDHRDRFGARSRRFP